MKLVLKDSTDGFMVLMVDANDHVTGLPGLTLSISLSKNGGVYNAVAPAQTDRGDGNYWIEPIAAHRDTLGENSWRFTATGADPVDEREDVKELIPKIYLGDTAIV